MRRCLWGEVNAGLTSSPTAFRTGLCCPDVSPPSMYILDAQHTDGAMMSTSRLARNALLTIAIVTLAACASLLWFLHPPGPHLAENSIAEQPQDPEYFPGGHRCAPFYLTRMPWGPWSDARDACLEAQEQHRLAINDLSQQRRAAQAAEREVAVGYQQTWIALWGVMLGILTLTAAGLAAYYAGVAALSSQQAISLSREVNGTQLRAWISVAEYEPVINVGQDGKIEFIGFYFLGENVGSTPALDATMSTDWSSQFGNPQFTEERDFGDSKTVIGPRTKFKSSEIYFSPLRMMESRINPVIIRCTVYYRDIFSN